ncbi:MAG: hypothetical protein ABSA52_05075 [Candidatus Binatia bacterium]
MHQDHAKSEMRHECNVFEKRALRRWFLLKNTAANLHHHDSVLKFADVGDGLSQFYRRVTAGCEHLRGIQEYLAA